MAAEDVTVSDLAELEPADAVAQLEAEDFERQRLAGQDEARAQAEASAAVFVALGDVGAASSSPVNRAEWALRLLCSWTVGKPAEADEVLQGLAILTVDQVVTLAAAGKKTP